MGKEQIQIRQLTEIEPALLKELNSLFDTGTEWDVEQGNKFLSNQSNALFVAYWDERMVGFITGYRLQRFDKRVAEVLLYEIGVGENFRRKGIGKRLVEELINWAKQTGADEVWVLTNKSNKEAVRLYQSVGGKTESKDEQMFVIKI